MSNHSINFNSGAAVKESEAIHGKVSMYNQVFEKPKEQQKIMMKKRTTMTRTIMIRTIMQNQIMKNLSMTSLTMK